MQSPSEENQSEEGLQYIPQDGRTRGFFEVSTLHPAYVVPWFCTDELTA